MDNFEIHIKQTSDGHYEVDLRASQIGRLQGQPPLIKIDLERPEFAAPIQYLSGLIACPDDIKQLGEEIRAILFPGEIWNLFVRCCDVIDSKANESFRVRLELDENAPRLGLIPWEYCYFPQWDDYVSLREPIPFVRYIERNYVPKELKTARPRLLIAMSSPDHPNFPQLDQNNEAELIEQLLKELDGHIKYHFLKKATYETISDELEKGYDIFHFLGHGWVEDNIGKLAFEDDKGKLDAIDSDDLRHLLKDKVKLVVLTACETTKYADGDIFKGIAQSLVQGRIPAVIAMQFILDYQVARYFIRDFYRFVAIGLPIDLALTKARIFARKNEKKKLSWGIPVLFLQAKDGILWPHQNAQDPKARAEKAANDSSGEAKVEDKIREALLALNFTYQLNELEAVRQTRRAGAFLLSPGLGLEDGYALYWLMSRLLDHLNYLDTGLDNKKLTLSSTALGTKLEFLWREIANSVGVPLAPEPTPEKIAEAVANQLKTKNFVLIFKDLNLVDLEIVRTTFWGILEKAVSAGGANVGRRGMLLMILLDQKNQLETAQIEPIRRLLPVEPIPDSEIWAWHKQQWHTLPKSLHSKNAIEYILKESEGVPDLVLQYIATLCQCKESDIIAAWQSG
jgi:hypothetical protein